MWSLMSVSPIMAQVFSKMFGCTKPNVTVFLGYLLFFGHMQKKKEREVGLNVCSAVIFP